MKIKIFKHIFILLAIYVLPVPLVCQSMVGNTCSGLFRWNLVPTSTKTIERKSEKKRRMNYWDEKKLKWMMISMDDKSLKKR